VRESTLRLYNPSAVVHNQNAALTHDALLCLTATAPNNRVSVGVAARLRHPNGSVVQLINVHEDDGGTTTNESSRVATVSAQFYAERGVPYEITSVVTAAQSWEQTNEFSDDIGAILADAAETSRVATAAAVSQRSALLARHAEWWREFWRASSLEMDLWPSVSALWRRLLYVMGSASRPSSPAPGLYGPWVTSDTPSWAGEYTLDYNYESPLWGVFTAGHPELAQSYFDPLVASIPLGRARAAIVNWSGGSLGFPGWQSNGFNNVGGANTSTGRRRLGGFHGVELPAIVGPTLCHGLCNYWWDTGQRSIAGFAALNFVSYYDHTQNKTWMETVGYPFVKEVAAFYLSWLVWDPTSQWYVGRVNDITLLLHLCFGGTV
jgi:hypothetical protein